MKPEDLMLRHRSNSTRFPSASAVTLSLILFFGATPNSPLRAQETEPGASESISVEDFFPHNETTADMFFVLFAGGGGNDTVRTTRTVARKKEVEEHGTELVFDGVGFKEVPVTTHKTITTHEEVPFSEDIGLYNDYALGGGVGINHFWKNVGVGITYAALSGHNAIHSLSASVIYRFPWVCDQTSKPIGVAPYLFAGIGGQFGEENLFTGHIGGGVEVRCSSRMGLFADAAWTCGGGDKNWATVRTGVRISFGGPEEPHTRVVVPASERVTRRDRADAWRGIDPLRKVQFR